MRVGEREKERERESLCVCACVNLCVLLCVGVRVCTCVCVWIVLLNLNRTQDLCKVRAAIYGVSNQAFEVVQHGKQDERSEDFYLHLHIYI